MKYLTLFSFALVLNISYAQQVIFSRDYNSSIGSTQFTSVNVCDTTSDGNYLFAGGGSSSLGSNYLYGVLDQSGNVLWQKDSSVENNIGMHDASFRSGKRTKDGGFIFCGKLANYGTSSVIASFILKTDAGGNELWRKNICQFQKGEASVVIEQNDSSLYIAGNVEIIQGSSNPYLLKLSADGDSMYMKTYPHTGLYPVNLIAIDDRFIMCGSNIEYDSTLLQYQYGYFLLGMDTSGNDQSYHQSFYTGIFEPENFSKTPDNRLVYSYTQQDSAFHGSVGVTKIDTSGTIIWNDIIATVNWNGSYAVTCDNGKILAVCGFNATNLIDENGNPVWSEQLADTSFQGFSTTRSHHLLQLDSTTFIISATRSVSAPGGSWPFITKISIRNPDGIVDPEFSSIKIYPNPVSSQLTVGNLQFANYIVKIYDLMGKDILEYSCSNRQEDQLRINVSDFSPGVYFVKVETEKGIFVQKFIKN